MKFFKCLAFSTLLAMNASGANAQNYEKGEAAYFANDYKTALSELMPLAESGVARAQSFIGIMYRDGKGVIQSDVEALKWTRMSADQGFSDAQCDLGLMYFEGHGVAQSHAEAVKWYRLAADQGSATCQVNLGNMYLDGRGVAKDTAEALRLYRSAANQGNAKSQLILGLAFQLGMGVIESSVMAHMWFNIAAANGESLAASLRDTQEGLMTKEDISKAQAMAQQCMSSGYKNCGE
jgi:TPR repeat protein